MAFEHSHPNFICCRVPVIMPDTVTVTTKQSCLSRLLGAVIGIPVGLALFIAAFPFLWWNEGRAVHRVRSLEEGAAVVVEAQAGTVDRALEGKLVHMTALAETNETLTDPDFGIEASSALRLSRVTETYQWKEESSKSKRKKLGGSEETVTTYRYSKAWASGHIDSNRFNTPSGHENPPELRWGSMTVTAGTVTFGAFTLPPDLVAKIDRREARPVQPADAELMAKQGFRVEGGQFYLGRNASAPEVGDVRVRFEVTRPATASIVAVQRGTTFEAFQARAGSSVLLLEEGTVPAEQMFKSALTANTVVTWLWRLAFFAMMFVGLVLVVRPLSVMASIVPFLGSLVGAGTGLVSFLLALVLSLTTIAMAWLFYRPLLGGGLLVAAGAALYLLLRPRKRSAVVPPPLPPPIPPIPPIPTGQR
jgi:hypothetical protein